MLSAAVSVIAVITYLAYQPQASRQTSHSVAPPQAQVSIVGNGFMPEVLSVKAGTQVTWTNNDIAPHQIAGDPYPTDDSIPGLKDTGILRIGDSYTFTFLIPATYHYHDDLNPTKLTGTIVVGIH